MTLIDDPVQTGDGHGSTEAGSKLFLGRFAHIDWFYESGFLIAVLGAAALALSLAARRPGWSIGQTPPDPALVQIYAAHFRHGDLFPVWSSSDAYGMGTPVLLYYQRAFFTVGGLVFIILGGSLKTTLVVTLGIFMVIGAYGMRKALGVITESRLLRFVGSIGFLLTNWAFSEWLIRGDLAEFSAFMVVPWLLFCCLTLVRDRRLPWLVVPTMVVLVWAHNNVALASIIVLTVSGVAFLSCYGLAGLRSIARRLILSIGVTALILAPGLLAEIRMGRYYDPATTIIYENSLISSFTFANPWAYIYDSSFQWLVRSNSLKEVPFELNIQLDFAITLLLALGVVTLLSLWLRKLVGRSASGVPNVNRAVVVVLVVSLAIYQLLQFRISLPVWDAFWQLKVLGYPFRMSTFSVPLALILAMVVADWYLRVFRTRWPKAPSWVPAVLALAWLALIVLLSPVTASEPAPAAGPLPYAPFVPIKTLTVPSHATFQTSSAAPLFAEYLPKVEAANGHEIPYNISLYRRLHQDHDEAASLSSVPCSVIQTSGTAFESLRMTYKVTCKGPTRFALPISYNAFTSIEEQISGAASIPVAVLHVPTDPRIVIQVQRGGTQTYVAQLPTLAGILF